MLTSCVAIAYTLNNVQGRGLFNLSRNQTNQSDIVSLHNCRRFKFEYSLKDIFKVVVPYLHLRVPGLRDMSKKDTLDRCPFM